jgi:hypothetical protein
MKSTFGSYIMISMGFKSGLIEKDNPLYRSVLSHWRTPGNSLLQKNRLRKAVTKKRLTEYFNRLFYILKATTYFNGTILVLAVWGLISFKNYPQSNSTDPLILVNFISILVTRLYMVFTLKASAEALSIVAKKKFH